MKKKLPKVNDIYFVKNKDLKIFLNKDKVTRKQRDEFLEKGHNVIIISVDAKRGRCRVKTITSLKYFDKNKNKWVYKEDALDAAEAGKLLPIPNKDLKTGRYSAIHHQTIEIPVSKLYISYSKIKYPKRYDNLIHRK